MTSQRLRRDKKAKIMQSVEVIEKMILTNSSFVYFSIYKLFLYYSIIHFFNKLYIVGSLVLNPWSNFVIRSWVALWSLVPVTKMDMNQTKRHDPKKNFNSTNENLKLAFGFLVRSCRIPLNILTATKKAINSALLAKHERLILEFFHNFSFPKRDTDRFLEKLSNFYSKFQCSGPEPGQFLKNLFMFGSTFHKSVCVMPQNSKNDYWMTFP